MNIAVMHLNLLQAIKLLLLAPHRQVKNDLEMLRGILAACGSCVACCPKKSPQSQNPPIMASIPKELPLRAEVAMSTLSQACRWLEARASAQRTLKSP